MDGENPLLVWGDGTQTRSFLYVSDFARGLMEITEKYAENDVLNLGSPEEVSIHELTYLLIKAAGKQIEVRFDPSKPAGQPRRKCDIQKAFGKIGFKAEVSLQEGLRKTIEWYRAEFLH
jgi:GDP-L-fucose synthase